MPAGVAISGCDNHAPTHPVFLAILSAPDPSFPVILLCLHPHQGVPRRCLLEPLLYPLLCPRVVQLDGPCYGALTMGEGFEKMGEGLEKMGEGFEKMGEEFEKMAEGLGKMECVLGGAL